jgi:hypothetical protein
VKHSWLICFTQFLDEHLTFIKLVLVDPFYVQPIFVLSFIMKVSHFVSKQIIHESFLLP